MLFAVGSVVPATSFVGFVDERTPLTGELDAVVKVGDDGSRLWLGDLYDAEHGVHASLMGTNPTRLLPSKYVSWGVGCCGETREQMSCGIHGCLPTVMPGEDPFVRYNDRIVFARGRALASMYCPKYGEPQPPYPPQCSIEERSPAGRYLAIQVRSECLAEAVPRPSTSGRIRPHADSGNLRFTTMPLLVAGVLVPPPEVKVSFLNRPELFDTVANAKCSPVRLSDGKIHCVPIRGFWEYRRFVDSGCTTPANGGNAVGQLEAHVAEDELTCPDGAFARIYDATPAGTAKPVYRRTPTGECVVNGGIGVEGIERSPAEFPELTVTDP